ncbi:pentapeptide repeat-containing protein [Vibrio palustris]|uniref:Pentapeptide repeats (8 copies) n=1 Tax=Vibrio palustris TaxID=1918946 RepID=A0A1R4B4P4_9VIBR|nr:pentapeptide repeat-containing protein [Vibrio palustris]SJL83887.1 Pentapeptide repeats (8 copies) [Vibrio palustris]
MTTLENNHQYFDLHIKNKVITQAQYCDIAFEECQFTDCDFSNTVFTHCKFINCSFERCNLSLVDLSHSTLSGIEFCDSKLMGIDWTKARWPMYHLDFELRFIRCILNDASFFGLTLHELVFDECKLHDVDFREGDYAHSTITYCDCRHSLFMRTNLQGVDFTDSTEYFIDVLENNIKHAKFSRYEALSLLEGLGIELVD